MLKLSTERLSSAAAREGRLLEERVSRLTQRMVRRSVSPIPRQPPANLGNQMALQRIAFSYQQLSAVPPRMVHHLLLTNHCQAAHSSANGP
jgi:hypothetical protein